MGIGRWIEKRLPLGSFIYQHLSHYYAPKNLNFWYYFGSLSLLVLVNQIISGIFLLMYYVPTAEGAFASVEFISREVQYGWLIRYLHTTGASAFFIVIYLHMFRALMYGSYRKPRELLWLIGMLLFILLMAEAYTGYVLPWGQMSFWAAKVILSLFSTIPYIGDSLVVWLQGDFVVSGVTLHRFFSFHVVLFPLVLIGSVFLHLLALHSVGSNNPDGVEIYDNVDAKGVPLDGIPFHPYYTVKDLFGAMVFLFLFLAVVFYAPTFWGYFIEPENYMESNPLVTPSLIKPVWYFSSYYAILRAIPSKSLGAFLMLMSVVILFAIPWLDRSRVKSIRYKGIFSRIGLVAFTVSFLGLMAVGTMPATGVYLILARILTVIYFLCFILMPFYTRVEKCKKPPSRLT
ncbi:MAG TPA: cytochrome b N-terminal domain-containing protein [Gammaproteobacteria bacterium]|nr:cytochrome b N-terminal domain-containing protein [Gammaproteobacteria bacterium]